MNIVQLAGLLSSFEGMWEFVTSKGLLKESMVCNRCNKNMKLTKKTSLKDGWIWTCMSKGCKKAQKSIRSNSVFNQSRLPIVVTLEVMYCFVANIRAVDCLKMLWGLVSYNAVLEWYRICRAVCSAVMNDENANFKFKKSAVEVQKVVEIDESFFGKKKKYQRGTGNQHYMVFGITERGFKRCILSCVPTNSIAVLDPLIKRNIHPSCTIYHDGLSTYANLHDRGYPMHEEINHKERFARAGGIHTNKIEGIWGNIKQKISYMHGLKSYEALAGHLDEFSYRSLYFSGNVSDDFDAFLEHASRYGFQALENVMEAPTPLDQSDVLIDNGDPDQPTTSNAMPSLEGNAQHSQRLPTTSRSEQVRATTPLLFSEDEEQF